MTIKRTEAPTASKHVADTKGNNLCTFLCKNKIKTNKRSVTLVLLNPDMPCFCKHSVDPDQLSSEEAS